MVFSRFCSLLPRLALAGFVLLISPLIAQQTASTPAHEPALDVTSMDRSVDACVDFFQYSCGGWIKKNPIPADQSSWDTYSKMQDENEARLRGILEAASAPDQKRNAAEQKIMQRRVLPKNGPMLTKKLTVKSSVFSCIT